jgi:hypothetical protein
VRGVDVSYRPLADLVLILHFGIVVFVVGALPLIVVGNLRGWSFVNGPLFRVAHLACIAIVVAQAWLGVVCPLTTLESWLRSRGGEATYETSFIEHWLTRLIFYEARPWVFTAAYTLFGLAVVAVWWRFPPAKQRR